MDLWREENDVPPSSSMGCEKEQPSVGISDAAVSDSDLVSKQIPTGDAGIAAVVKAQHVGVKKYIADTGSGLNLIALRQIKSILVFESH